MLNPQTMYQPQMGTQAYWPIAAALQSALTDGRGMQQPFVWQPPLVQPGQISPFGQPGMQAFGGLGGQLGQFGLQAQPGQIQQTTAQEIQSALPYVLPHLVGLISSLRQQAIPGVHPSVVQQATAQEIQAALPYVLPHIIGVISSLRQQGIGLRGILGQISQMGIPGQVGQMGMGVPGQQPFAGQLGQIGQPGQPVFAGQF